MIINKIKVRKAKYQVDIIQLNDNPYYGLQGIPRVISKVINLKRATKYFSVVKTTENPYYY